MDDIYINNNAFHADRKSNKKRDECYVCMYVFDIEKIE